MSNARDSTGSIKSFLTKSQNTAANLLLISLGSAQSSVDLINQMASTAQQLRLADQLALQQTLNPQPVNYNLPATLDPVLYFGNGSFLDTSSNILTMSDGTQIDTSPPPPMTWMTSLSPCAA